MTPEAQLRELLADLLAGRKVPFPLSSLDRLAPQVEGKLRAAADAIRADLVAYQNVNSKRILSRANGGAGNLAETFSGLIIDDDFATAVEEEARRLPERAKGNGGVNVSDAEAARILVLETLKPKTAAEIACDSTPEPAAIVTGLLYLATVLVIAGPPKVGKTWLALLLAFCLITGKPFLGFDVPERRRILYLGGEGDERHFKKRILAALPFFDGIEDRDLENLLILPTLGRVKLDDPAGEAAIARCGADADVVIVDPIFRFQGRGDENSHSDARALQDTLDRMKAAGKTLVLVHHLRKAGLADSGISELRGAGWDAFCDSALRLQRKREESGARFMLKFDLRHDEAPEDLELVREGPLFSVADVGKRIVTPDDVVAVLTEAEGGRVEGRQALIEALARRTGCKATSSSPKDAILKAESAGLIFSARRAGTRGQGRTYALKVGLE